MYFVSLLWFVKTFFIILGGFPQRVLEFEKERTSEILDAFRDLQFRKDKGHMSVEMTKTDEGWEVRPQKKQVKKSYTGSSL